LIWLLRSFPPDDPISDCRRGKDLSSAIRKGLFVLFFAEMWERFSYYGMRALLIFYLTKHWLFDDAQAGVIYGAYTALVYITPVLGGYLADKYLGQRKAVAYGAVLLTFGHFLMGFEGNGGQDAASLNIFWLALAFIIVGSGFLKANISVIVGQLYPRTDVRRDGAYTIFYMGINLGAFLGSLLCGYLGETYGWSYGFGAAGFGMLLGLIVFTVFKPLLLGRGEAPAPLSKGTEWGIYGLGILAVGACWWMVQNQAVVGTLLGLAGAVAGALRAVHRGGEAAAARSRPHPRRNVPYHRFDPVLGAVRTGRILTEPVYRSPRRSHHDGDGGACIRIPVGQFDLHSHTGAAVRRTVAYAGAARAGAFCTC
jgi:dipeptide/tripeptide permease